MSTPINPETIRVILSHAAMPYLRPANRRVLDNALDNALFSSAGCTSLQLEYSPWKSGGAITLSIMPRAYGEDGIQVEVNWPGCGARTANDAEGFFMVGALIVDLAAQIERHLALGTAR